MDIAAWVTYFTTGTNWVIPVLILWLAPWKLIALYRAARRGQWLTFLLFVVLVPVNDFGIVEMFYIFSWSRERGMDAEQTRNYAEQTRKNSERMTSKSGRSFFAKPEPQVETVDIAFSPQELKDYKGPRRDAPEVKELAQTNGVGKIDIAGLSELERMRKLAKERGEEKSLTPPPPKERGTVRPDVPIPKPPTEESGIRNTESETTVTKPDKNRMVTVLTAPSEVPKPMENVTALMPGVYVVKKDVV